MERSKEEKEILNRVFGDQDIDLTEEKALAEFHREAEAFQENLEQRRISAVQNYPPLGRFRNEQQNRHENMVAVQNKKLSCTAIEDLVSANGLEVGWIWEGYLARGLKTQLSAFWGAGKTTLLLNLFKALKDGSEFCGQKTVPTKVWIISEEDSSIWVNRRELEQLTGFYIDCKPIDEKLTRQQWEQWLGDVADIAEKKQVSLVIFDTISDFWSVGNDDKAVEVKDALRPLNKITQKNIGVLLIHHSSRQGNREGGMGRGSGALPADVDIVIDLLRFTPDDDFDNRRILHAVKSRFSDITPKELTILYQDYSYKAIGSKREVQKEEKIQQVLQAIEATNKVKTIEHIREAIVGDSIPSRPTVYRILQQLRQEGIVTETAGVGNAGATYEIVFVQGILEKREFDAQQDKNRAHSAVQYIEGIHSGNVNSNDVISKEEIII